ncbi:hypothetical protein GSI_04587 [Ganoderma sinense ZZ0214-1]|uniref:F-box domain-containing protein n=1 Tax=Ganoderma sinense ZZ0214-1 TaxID=1077348 RepID=A0A2G8SHU7_9APHY|nr:hypothetical protein GSI_04587 [Ganoderma sinense ZZ0214-1]
MSDVPKILRKVTAKMGRLQRLKLDVQDDSKCGKDPVAELDLRQWEAESLPYLERLEISGDYFSRATTVPSLHTLVLLGPGVAKSLPRLLDGLKACPSLVKVRLDFDIYTDIMDGCEGGEAPSPDCILDLPKLRKIRVAGMVPVIHTFLSRISFPAALARVELVIPGTEKDPTQPPILPDILPRHLSVLHMFPTIDRLFLQSDVKYESVPFVSVRGHVQGAERLRVSPAVWLHTADHLMQLLEVFRACTVTELALDLRRVTSDMSGEFWGRFFEVLPDLRRLQLPSCTLESREIKRDIAEHFLASCRESRRTAHDITLAWVVRADMENPSHLEEELGDVQQVFRRHAECGGRIGRLELMATSLEPRSVKVVDVTQVSLDLATWWWLKRAYVSQLAEATEVVALSGQVKLWSADDDDDDEDGFEDDGTDRDDEPEMCSENDDEYEDKERGPSLE